MRGVISAPQPEAAEAGADVLRDGGNAVDAAVACALAQTAVDPLMCGVAGFGTMHVFLPGEGVGGCLGVGGVHRVLDFHGRAPLAVREDMWADLVRGEAEDGFGFLLEGAVNEIGYQSITTPMTLRAFDSALERFGSRKLPGLLRPAIEYCEDGFQVRPHVSAYWNEGPVWGRVAHTEYLTRFEATRKVYLRPDGRIPGVGDSLRNPDMGRTYRRIAEHGAEDFYSGGIAARIVADIERGGGLLSAEDLARAAPDETEPLSGSYRGFPVATNRPPGGGVMVLEMLNILEHFDLAAMGHNSPEYIAVVSEAMKIATVDKDTRVGDPRYFETPIAELTSKEYGARMAGRIRGGEKTHVPRLNAGGPRVEGHHPRMRRRRGRELRLPHPLPRAPVGGRHRGARLHVQRLHGGVRSPTGAGRLPRPRQGAVHRDVPDDGLRRGGALVRRRRSGRDLHHDGGPPGHPQRGRLRHERAGIGRRAALLRHLRHHRHHQPDHAPDGACAPRHGYPVRRSPLSFSFAGVHALRRTAAGGWEGGADPGRDGMALAV